MMFHYETLYEDDKTELHSNQDLMGCMDALVFSRLH